MARSRGASLATPERSPRFARRVAADAPENDNALRFRPIRRLPSRTKLTFVLRHHESWGTSVAFIRSVPQDHLAWRNVTYYRIANQSAESGPVLRQTRRHLVSLRRPRGGSCETGGAVRVGAAVSGPSRHERDTSRRNCVRINHLSQN